MLRPWSQVVASSRDVGPDDVEHRKRLARPRTDLLREREVLNGRTEIGHEFVFTQEHGPFTTYKRIVELVEATDRKPAQIVEQTRYRVNIPWFGWLFRIPIRGVLARRISAHGWWSPPDQLDPTQLLVIGLLAAASMAAAFVNTIFTQTVGFAADDFGISETAKGDSGSIVRAGIVFALPAAVTRRSDRPPNGSGDRGMACPATDAARCVRAKLRALGSQSDGRSSDGHRSCVRRRRDSGRRGTPKQPGPMRSVCLRCRQVSALGSR